MISLALCVTYVAMVALYHAHPKRAAESVLGRVQSSHLGLLRLGGVTLLVSGLALCISSLDLARGMSIWLGMVSIAATGSLVCATLRPRMHLTSVPAAVLAVLLFESFRAWA